MKVFRKMGLAMRRMGVRKCVLSFAVVLAVVSGIVPAYAAEQAQAAPSEKRVSAEKISQIAQAFEQRQDEIVAVCLKAVDRLSPERKHYNPSNPDRKDWGLERNHCTVLLSALWKRVR